MQFEKCRRCEGLRTILCVHCSGLGKGELDPTACKHGTANKRVTCPICIGTGYANQD
jgi:hypothetical protein